MRVRCAFARAVALCSQCVHNVLRVQIAILLRVLLRAFVCALRAFCVQCILRATMRIKCAARVICYAVARAVAYSYLCA